MPLEPHANDAANASFEEWYRSDPFKIMADGSLLLHATHVENAHVMIEQFLAGCHFSRPLDPLLKVKTNFKSFIKGKPLVCTSYSGPPCAVVQQGDLSYFVYDSGIPLDTSIKVSIEGFPFEPLGVTADNCRWLFSMAGHALLSDTAGLKFAYTYRTVTKMTVAMAQKHGMPFLVARNVDVPMRLTNTMSLNMILSGKHLKRVHIFDSGFVGETQDCTADAFYSEKFA